jgi:hypothetical protein
MGKRARMKSYKSNLMSGLGAEGLRYASSPKRRSAAEGTKMRRRVSLKESEWRKLEE